MPGQRAADVRLRNIGVEDDLWAAAKARAASEGRSLSEVIRQFLREYVTPQPPTDQQRASVRPARR